ncbi:DMT family transporter [Polynucleobacter brandtiae]|uniref:Drug/metabolite transporter (DMT)-like permease n=1 Tax=Polynucleobacter brandtiae TaxID=1938816 RepID=A0A2M8VQS3_9BURK|nr:DMT family transporter [Polynucleobacter brandtiae]PJI79502.1 drug/metabolite transporter (DMT)-like permease [Polynucleobacter brandtiae]
MNNESKGMLIGFIGILIFSLTLPVSKIAVLSFDPYFIAFGRAALAGLVALAYLLFKEEAMPSKVDLVKCGVIALGVVFGFPIFTTVAMTQGSSSHGAVILGMMPLATTVIGVIRFKERPSLGFWLVSLLGAAIVMTYAVIKNAGGFTRVDILLVLGGISACIGYVEGGELSRKMNPRAVISWALVISLPINLVVAYYLFDQAYTSAGSAAWLSFIYLSLFPMFLGFFFWYEGLAMGGIARVSQVQLIQPFCTLLAASVLLGDSLTWTNLLFAALVVSTVILGKKMLVKRSPS